MTNMLSRVLFTLVVATTTLASAADEKTIVFFGDSLTAGYGLDDPAEAFPGVIAKKIAGAGLPYRVVNAGLSGETSAGGLRRIDWVLRQRVDVFVLELGANDGLRGLPPEATQANLQAIIDRVREKNPAAKLLLAGMRVPTNLGSDYTEAFRDIFPKLAEKNRLPLIPFLLEGVAMRSDLNQPDQIHPTAAGHAVIADTVWKTLQPLL